MAVKSGRSRHFLKLFDALDEDGRQAATRAYLEWRRNPTHPGLRFKKVEGRYNTYSIRIGRNYRAACNKETSANGDVMYVWFWIGPHDEYDRMLEP